MATGGYGGYGDNDFRDRESNFEFSRRVLATANEDSERIRNSKHVIERSRVQERVRVRQRDVKEREGVNGGYRSSSSRSDSGCSGGKGYKLGPKRCEFSFKIVDREPGELSSESGSDDAIESESQVKDAEESKKVIENGTQTSAGRKRKFSPIIWDKDDSVGGVTKSSKSRITHSSKVLPPPPPLPKSYSQSVVRDGRLQISPIYNNQGEDSQCLSPVKQPVVSVAVEDPIIESPPVHSYVLLKQQHGNDQEAAELEDEDHAPTRNISSSRWAAGNNSPADEGEILEDEEMPKRKKMLPGSLETSVQNKSLTPEPGELRRDGSERASVRSFESDEQRTHARSSSEDGCPDIGSYQNNFMQVDEEDDIINASSSHSNTDTEDDDDHHKTAEPTIPPPRSINMLQGCRSVDEFERLNKIDEGTYGVVYRARDRKTGEIVALKKVKMEKEREGFPLTSLREINILLSFHHPSIVDVKEVVVGSSLDSIFMVMEYMEHDLKGLMETMRQPFSQSEVKCLMLQLLEGIKYLHDNWVLHRDLKTSNILFNNRGELKLCDFGLARQYGSPLKPYTHLVVTLWYRAPELLLGAKQYSTAVDMWSLGCIMAELLSKEPLFNGKTEVDQLDKVFRTLGTPNETIWLGFSKLPGVKVNFVKHQYNLLRKKFPATSFTGSPVISDAGFDLLNRLLTYDPEKRITAEAALNHEWFREVPLPKSKEFMPTFPAQHAQDRRMRRIMKSPDPLEEQRRKDLQQGELGTGGVFG